MESFPACDLDDAQGGLVFDFSLPTVVILVVSGVIWPGSLVRARNFGASSVDVFNVSFGAALVSEK